MPWKTTFDSGAEECLCGCDIAKLPELPGGCLCVLCEACFEEVIQIAIERPLGDMMPIEREISARIDALAAW